MINIYTSGRSGEQTVAAGCAGGCGKSLSDPGHRGGYQGDFCVRKSMGKSWKFPMING
jgi:hypothetical protein